MLFISAAYAQEVATTTAAAVDPAMQQPSALAGIMPILLILVVFYFLLIRPQQKKYKAHLEMVNAIAKGDHIVTSGGIIGKVTKVEDDNQTLHVEIAEGVVVKVIRATVSGVVDAKGAPIPAPAKTAPAAKAEKPKAAATKKAAPAKKPTKAA